MCSQKSSAKAETYATTFAKPNCQPIEVLCIYALTGFSVPLFSNTQLQARKETLRKAQTALTHQLDRLTEAYLLEVIPLAEYQRRRQDVEQKQHALAVQEAQLEAQVDRQAQLAGMVTSIEAFCQRVRSG